MSHLPVEPPAFFHRGLSPAARLVFFGLLSIVLLFLDTRYRYLEQVRQVVATVMNPLQHAAAFPGEVLSSIGDYFVSKKSLAKENQALKQELAQMAVASQGVALTRQQNAQLKALLDIKAQFPGEAMAAVVLYSGRDAFSQKLFIDKGSEAGIAAGSAVVDAGGVVGQVTRLYPHLAEVTLVTDKDHVIPVKLERSGVRAVMAGAGTGRAPELKFMPPSADVRIGDVVITSGLDGTYPAGLAVGRVATLDRDVGQMFARITLALAGGVDRSEHLLVLKLPDAVAPLPETAEAPRQPAKSAARKAR